jgi:hypothetical protein
MLCNQVYIWGISLNVIGSCVCRKEFQQRLGVTIAFVATHSGLTRWQELPGEENREQL